MLCVELEPDQTVMFEPQALVWKEASIRLHEGASELMQADGPGRCGFGRGFPGEIFPMPLELGEAVEIRADHFLFGIGVERAAVRLQDLGDRLSGGAGLAVDRFTGGPGGGVVWVQARGDLFERGLMQGEPFDIRAEFWLCKDAAVEVQAIFPTGGADGPAEIACLRFIGRGRVAFQTGAPPPILPPPAASKPGPRYDFGIGRLRSG